MNRKELANIVAKKANISFSDAENLVSAFESSVVETLEKEEKVVYSNFGTFYTVHYPSKVIYHPKLGAEKKMVMLPTNAMKWMPSGVVKEAVEAGKVSENPTEHGSVKNKGFVKNIQDIFHPESSPKENEPEPEQEVSYPEEDEEIEIPIKLTSKRQPEPELKEEESDEIPITVTNKIKSSEAEIDEETVEVKVNPTTDDKNIFEEKTKDGAEIATFDGSIRLHERPSFLNRFFGRKNNQEEVQSTNNKVEDIDTTDELKPRISLAGSGIFDTENSAHPELHKAPASEDEQPENSDGEEEIPVNIKSSKSIENDTETKADESIGKIEIQENSFQFHNGYQHEEEEIKPIDTSKKQIDFIDLSQKPIDKKLLQKIPERVARKYKLAPVEENENEFVIAMVDPEDIEAKDMIHKYVQKTVIPKLASEEDINRVLDQYNGFEVELKDAIETANGENPDGGVDTKALRESASDSAPASRIVSSILRRAIREKASDIHIEPSENEVEVRYRIDGILIKKVVLPKKLQSGAISRIKILSNMKIDEQRLPQDGRFSITLEDRKVDFRVSTMPVAYGEKVVMRILDKLTGILTIDELGIRGKARELLDDNLKKSHGMMLVTGPTGSGKTTTLYALLSHLFAEGVNIVTLEDPIEYQIPGINQSQINAEINYTFASGLRSIVRQDPDIIMIGEIRDGETADMAIHAALTGHIVLSTLHTNSAAGAAPRLIDMDIEPFLLNSSLNMVIGQRLARELCSDCKKKISLADDELKEILEEIDRMPEATKSKIDRNYLNFYTNGGCEKCARTGYKGRIGVYEVLSISDEIKTLILKKESSEIVEAQAIKEGMVTMLQDGILKALDGITTIEEVWRVTKE